MAKKKNQKDEVGLKKFGARVRELRKAKKLSIEELANISGLEYSQVSRIERAKINTGVSHILLLATALEVHPNEFFTFFQLPKKKKRPKDSK